jgi:hypothetical protein
MLFKKIISFTLLFSLFISSSQAGTLTGLKSAADEFQYALTVEWDQKDKAFYNEQAEKFLSKIEGLREQGLTTEQFNAFMVSEVKDKDLAKSLETSLMMVKLQNLSSSESSELVFQTLSRHYSKGSSWNGSVVITGILIASLIGLAIYGLSQIPSCADKGNCSDSRSPMGPSCDTYCSTGYTNCQQQCFWL